MKLLLPVSICALFWGCETVQNTEPIPSGYQVKTVAHQISESEAREMRAKYPAGFKADLGAQQYRVDIEINRGSNAVECISKGAVCVAEGECLTWCVGLPFTPLPRETGGFEIRVSRTNGVVAGTVDGVMKYDGKAIWRTKQEMLVDASPAAR